MHRTAPGDLDELRMLLGTEVTFDRRPRAGRRRAAHVLGACMPDAHANARERPALAARVQAQRHRGAGTEPRAHQVVRCRPGPQTADFDRLVGEEMRAAGVDLDLEVAFAGRLDHHLTALVGAALGGAWSR